MVLELIERIIGNEPYCQLWESPEVLRQGQPLQFPGGGLFPPMLVEMVRVGEETGALTRCWPGALTS